MENEIIPHGERIQELCEYAGVHLIYLSLYSPEYNPIGGTFSIFKAIFFCTQIVHCTLTEGEEEVIEQFAIEVITPHFMQNLNFTVDHWV